MKRWEESVLNEVTGGENNRGGRYGKVGKRSGEFRLSTMTEMPFFLTVSFSGYVSEIILRYYGIALVAAFFRVITSWCGTCPIDLV